MALSNKKIISFQILQLAPTKKIFLVFISTCLLFTASAQSQWPRFSIATDVNSQHSFTKNQQFWAVGHTIIANFHLTSKDGIYVWFGYNVGGKFSNQLTGVAKLPATNPQQIGYTNNARIAFRNLSAGWKRYLKGTPDAEKGWNLYGYAGFGLMMGKIKNKHSVQLDTAVYDLPVLNGDAGFKRLTIDAGLGGEIPLGGDFYFYSEIKTGIPASDYPSKYIFVNDRAPFVSALAIGLRLLF